MSSHHEGSTVDQSMDDSMTCLEAACQPAERRHDLLERISWEIRGPYSRTAFASSSLLGYHSGLWASSFLSIKEASGKRWVLGVAGCLGCLPALSVVILLTGLLCKV